MATFDLPPLNKKKTWVVVADGKRMRAFESQLVEKIVPMGGTTKRFYQMEQAGWELNPLPKMSAEAEPVSDFQAGHDRRGSIFGPTASVRHTVEPHLDIRKETKSNLARVIAMKLQQANNEKSFDHLILVAQPRMLADVKELLAPSVRKKIAVEIPKELTQLPNHELLAHIKDALPVAAHGS